MEQLMWGRKWDFSSQPLLSNARSAEFSSMKVTKLCYEKYFVLVSNHNVIGSKDLKLVSNWFERYWSLVISVGKLFFCNWSSRHTVMLMMLFHLFLTTQTANENPSLPFNLHGHCYLPSSNSLLKWHRKSQKALQNWDFQAILCVTPCL